MSVTAPQVNERLAALTAAGTSVWLDQIRRGLIEGGELGRLVAEDSLRGVTSNPAIFEAAIIGSPEYDDQITELARAGADNRTVYQEIAIRDVQMAADVLRGVYDDTGGDDGYVSLEVDPDLANDTERSIEQARDYWRRVDRPNVMIKIPGTDAGTPAIEQLIYEGLNINVTLLFSIEAYERIAEAYIRGIERRLAENKSIDMRSVASFFVSRVDTEVDKRLEALGRTDLAGRAGIANARAAYRRFKEIFHGERFAALRDIGGHVQRPLWASTSTKNPHYPDTMYVDGLVGPETVNTMPLATLYAAADHAHIDGTPTAEIDPEPDLAALAEAGIDMSDVTKTLLIEAIDKFIQPMQKLLAGIEEKREAIVTGRPPTIEASLPRELEAPLAARIKQATSEQVARRVWHKDETLWGGGRAGRAGPDQEIGNRLGWLTIADAMLEDVDAIEQFARGCAADGLTDAVLLGMGGSSLAPEVLRASFGEQSGALRLHVLDSTDPDAIRGVERRIDIAKTLFVVSSKSGGTIEPRALFSYFHARVSDTVGADTGSHFIAITDPGSPLIGLAEQHGFRHTFLNDPDIGGRYSALSYFGLVPAALAGIDIRLLLERAGVAEQTTVSFDSSAGNAGLWLGLAIGELALHGRDKLTFVVSEPIASFGLWAEQLVAESTGKQGKGVLPVADEPLGEPDAYGPDRVFAYLRNVDAPDARLESGVQALRDAGEPVMTLAVHGAVDLGRIFFFSEFATAVAGWVLQINPFDQPNVQEAKENTQRLLEQYKSTGALPSLPDADDDALRALLDGLAPPHYFAILGYVPPSPDFDAAVASLRTTIRAATGVATTFGYGPRYLHSTGQFHKGGPPVGRFLQVVGDAGDELEIPGEPFGFRTLEQAQAIGDLQTLRAHGRPAERVTLSRADPAAELRALEARIKTLLPGSAS
jgi:transaldolase/glucose-6-phosphate isomerase